MRILVLNSGSSSLKFQFLVVAADAPPRRLARGAVMRLGAAAQFSYQTDGDAEALRREMSVPDHEAAVRLALEHLPGPVDAVGHRVVHGARRFDGPAVVTEEVEAAIEELIPLAPLHNPAALMGVRAARAALGGQVPMVVVFDTVFHRTIPEAANSYALPWELAQRLMIRRYGFHGIAHRYMAQRAARLMGREAGEINLITMQLGNGCSVTAVERGRSVETSMGFTPLEGLVMGTRAGDADPALVKYLVERGGLGIEEADAVFNHKSGLLGLSGVTNDMAELERLMAQGHDRARLAVDVFCHRARKYLGAYLAVLGGAHAVVFGGGIGENSPLIRSRILSGLSGLGMNLDEAANLALGRSEGMISAPDSRIQAWVVPVDEESLICQDTFDILNAGGAPPA